MLISLRDICTVLEKKGRCVRSIELRRKNGFMRSQQGVVKDKMSSRPAETT